MDTPTVWIGVGVGVNVGGGGGGGGGGGVGSIVPSADRVWLVVRRPAVSAVSSMAVMTIAITAAFDPRFLDAILDLNCRSIESEVIINVV